MRNKLVMNCFFVYLSMHNAVMDKDDKSLTSSSSSYTSDSSDSEDDKQEEPQQSVDNTVNQRDKESPGE